MKERRKNKRWVLNTTFNAYRENHDGTASHLADISTDGMMLISKHPVQTSIIMPLRVEVTDEVSPDGELRVTTQIVRCSKDKNIDDYHTGCKLIDLSNSSLEMIQRMIDLYHIE
ncbi:MAG: PilZ domain-containing protein [bacterium]